eukprot:tig00000949_g5751.t1
MSAATTKGNNRISLNPDELPYYAPVPALYGAVVGVWILYALLWIFSWYRFRRRHNVVLQRAMTVVPAMKTVLGAVTVTFFRSCIGSGSGECELPLFGLYVTVWVLYECSQFTVLLLISKGWCVTRANLAMEEHRHIKIIVLLLGLSLLAYYVLNQLFAFGLIVVYFILLGSIFSNLSVNLRALKAQLLLIRQHQIDPLTTPAYGKFRMFRALQTIMTTYVFCNMMLQVVVALLLNMQWVNMLLREILDLLMYTFLGWTFRFRRRNPFLTSVPVAAVSADAEAQARELARQGWPSHLEETQLGGPDLRSWAGEPLPAVPLRAGAEAPAATPMVVVQNPPTLDEHGKLVPNVAMAKVDAPHGARVAPAEPEEGPPSGERTPLEYFPPVLRDEEEPPGLVLGPYERAAISGAVLGIAGTPEPHQIAAGALAHSRPMRPLPMLAAVVDAVDEDDAAAPAPRAPLPAPAPRAPPSRAPPALRPLRLRRRLQRRRRHRVRGFRRGSQPPSHAHRRARRSGSRPSISATPPVPPAAPNGPPGAVGRTSGEPPRGEGEGRPRGASLSLDSV